MTSDEVVPPLYLLRQPEETDHDLLLVSAWVSGRFSVLKLPVRRTLHAPTKTQPDGVCTYRVIRPPRQLYDELLVDQPVKIDDQTLLEPRGWSYPYREIDLDGYRLVVAWGQRTQSQHEETEHGE